MMTLSLSVDRAITLALVVLFIGTIASLHIFPIRTLEYTDLPLKTPDEVSPGEVLPMDIAYCKRTSLAETISGQIESQDNDRVVKQMETIDGSTSLMRNLKEGCHTIHSEIWRLPSDTPAGRCYVASFTITYTPNAFRVINKHSYTERFCTPKEVS